MEYLVSVIIPVYKVEKYLERAVDSVINQSYTNLEIILIDDGSPDRCGEICDQYVAKDARISVIHQRNQGLSAARNAGVDKARGEYVFFLDSDDYILSYTIELLVQAINKTQCCIVQCDFFRFNDEEHIELENEKNLKECEIISYTEALKNIDDSRYMAAWNKLYDRRLFRKIKFPEGMIHEDTGCTYQLFFEAQKICIIKNQLYGYYCNANSITTSKISLKKLDLVHIYDKQADFFLEHKLKENYCRALNNLFATFGILLTYSKEKYENYESFSTELAKRYLQLYSKYRYNKCLRMDLRILVYMSRGNVALFKYYYLLRKFWRI